MLSSPPDTTHVAITMDNLMGRVFTPWALAVLDAQPTFHSVTITWNVHESRVTTITVVDVDGLTVPSWQTHLSSHGNMTLKRMEKPFHEALHNIAQWIAQMSTGHARNILFCFEGTGRDNPHAVDLDVLIDAAPNQKPKRFHTADDNVTFTHPLNDRHDAWRLEHRLREHMEQI